MRDENLGNLEQDLKRVVGVRSARVVGDDAPSEIHIVAVPGRSAKQLVRDVQSLASAGYGLEIDHRIVSIVQLEDDAPKQVTIPSTNGAARNGHVNRRPALEAVVLSSQGDTGWVKVTLKWPDGTNTEGAAPATSTRESRARAATNALQKALEPAFKERGVQLEVTQVVVQHLGTNDSVLVQGAYEQGRNSTSFLGSALISDDVATAAVHALLQAVNRKLMDE
ncbi:MAG: hypothetical protein QOH26_436 [Actinomycetota bacterium]|jgi:hypothetical protein|nr:hypothetical protein [Actinomycetota bacterium]